MRIEAANNRFTVVIDAGHGGKDIGATDNGVMEKNINLKVAKELESLIKKKMKEANVVMTRNSDTYLTLQQRADIANKSQGDIFISIHTNSVDKKNSNRKNISGSQVYTLGLHKDENNLEVAMRENSVIELEQDYQQKYSGFDPQRDESYIIFEMAQKKNLSRSIQFAENIEKELIKSGRKDRGVHQAGFWVLWATSMPSVLIELDFICNPVSAEYMSSDKGAKELAEAIFKALQTYEKTWEKSRNDSKTISSIQVVKDDKDIQSIMEETVAVVSTQTVATAKTRTQKSQRVHIDNNTATSNIKKSNARRRRSKRSRELSMNQEYETDLALTGFKNRPESTISNDELLAVASNNTKAKTKEEKKREKQEQKRLKEEQKKAAKQRKKDAHNAKVNKLVTVYKIQILASSDLLNQGNSRFCGLTPITTYKENNLYKYYYGESTNREELETVLTDVRKKIPDAFIVSSQKIMQK